MSTKEKWDSFVDQTEQRRKYQDFRQLGIFIFSPDINTFTRYKAWYYHSPDINIGIIIFSPDINIFTRYQARYYHSSDINTFTTPYQYWHDDYVHGYDFVPGYDDEVKDKASD